MSIGKLSAAGPILLAALLLTVAASCKEQADHDHAGHDHTDHVAPTTSPGTPTSAAQHEHDHSHHAATPDSLTYADAVKQIRSHMASLNSTIAAGKYKDVHNDAKAIIGLCESMEKLAAAPGSNVAADKVSAVSGWAKELSTATDAMHDAAHGDDVAGLKEHYAHMTKLVESLAQVAPTTAP